MDDLYPNLFKKLTRNPITIILLDGRRQYMIYDKTTKLSTLFEETCNVCHLEKDNLFGFATLMDDYYAFLNLDTKVCKINFKEIIRRVQNNSNFSYFSPVHQPLENIRRSSQGNNGSRNSRPVSLSTISTRSAPIYSLTPDESDTPVLYFKVKSYVFPHCLRDKVTKSLYFLQLLRNVLNYKFKIVDEVYLQLGSLAIQAYYGDYDVILASVHGESSQIESSTNAHSYSPTLARLSRISTSSFDFSQEEMQAGKYFEPKKFFPSWIIDRYTPAYLFKEIPLLHKSLKGMSRVESEFSYIRMASAQYSNFNLHLFPVRGQQLLASNSSFMSPSLQLKPNGVKMTKGKRWLGLSPAGMEMHQMKKDNYIEHLSTLKWSDIDEVSHKSSRVGVHLGCRILELYTNTKMQADHLFWLTQQMHMYQSKARLNAPYTAEALENAERQRHREKYVYMDLEDLELNGAAASDAPLPLDKPLAVALRRVPSKAKQIRMKDLLKMANCGHNSTSSGQAPSVHAEKHPQYVKKSRANVYPNNYTPTIFKGLSSPISTSELVHDSPFMSQSYTECTDKIETELNTSIAYENLYESDTISSIYGSESRSSTSIPVKPPGRFVSLGRLLLNDEDYQCDESVISPPPQFRESNSCSTCTKPGSQKHESDTQINYTNEISNERMVGDGSVNMKSWKSSVLFDLDACLDDDNVESFADSVDLGARPMDSYCDMISLSSLSDSDNDHDSVDISSISSFELSDLKYSRRSMIGHIASVAII